MEQATKADTLFDAFGDAEWALLRERMELRDFAPGDPLITQGDLEPPFLIIASGYASVSAAGHRGHRQQLGALGAGDCAGDMSLLTGEPASADVTAETALTAHVISQDRLATLGDLRTRLVGTLAGQLAARLRHANDRILARHAAAVHAVVCTPGTLGAVRRLPAEVARVVDAPVLAVIVGGALREGRVDQLAGRDVSTWQLGDDDLHDLRRMLGHAAHEFDQILLLGDVPLDGIDLASTTRVVHERDLQAAPSSARTAVVSTQPWTRASTEKLSRHSGRTIVALLPEDAPPSGPGDPVARLARLLTGRQVGLALGAGAAKGVAHIGVLRAFQEMSVPIDVISGSSIGAAIAAGWAGGHSVDELAEMSRRISARAVRPTVPLHSFLSSGGIRAELDTIAAGRRFEDLDIPCAVAATDIYRRCDVTFSTGAVAPRILASMAIPGIYPAMRGGGSYLVDGSVLSPVPARACRELGAGVVIGVRLTGERTSPREQLDVDPSRPLATETIMRCLEIMHNRLSELSKSDADLTIEVCLERGGLRDFNRADEIMEAGYQAAVAVHSQITATLPYVEAGALPSVTASA